MSIKIAPVPNLNEPLLDSGGSLKISKRWWKWLSDIYTTLNGANSFNILSASVNDSSINVAANSTTSRLLSMPGLTAGQVIAVGVTPNQAGLAPYAYALTSYISFGWINPTTSAVAVPATTWQFRIIQ